MIGSPFSFLRFGERLDDEHGDAFESLVQLAGY